MPAEKRQGAIGTLSVNILWWRTPAGREVAAQLDISALRSHLHPVLLNSGSIFQLKYSRQSFAGLEPVTSDQTGRFAEETGLENKAPNYEGTPACAVTSHTDSHNTEDKLRTQATSSTQPRPAGSFLLWLYDCTPEQIRKTGALCDAATFSVSDVHITRTFHPFTA